MSFKLQQFIAECQAASEEREAQDKVQTLICEAMAEPEALSDSLADYSRFAKLEDLIFHRTDTLTLLAARLPPGFVAGPHNHNLWSVVGVYGGQEDNIFYERDGDKLREVGHASVVAPGVLGNAKEVIHGISNPLDTGLLALHAYGGDLLTTPRSTWDPETHHEIPFAWRTVIHLSQ
jgi:predicted metal-dependent enzyme (double-stranded beta helix superfamily)